MAGRMTAEQRKHLRRDIATGLTALYLGHKQRYAAGLGITATVTPAAKKKIAAEATKRAQQAQAGVNTFLGYADDRAQEDDTDPDTQRTAAIAGMGRYNRDILIISMALWAANRARADAYTEAPDPQNPGQSAADGTLWTWTQNSAYDDRCAAAADASPAPRDQLIAIAGGEPQTHPGCMCELSPTDNTLTASESLIFTHGVKRGDLRCIAVDLDDTALSPALAPVLMPLLRMAKAHGVDIGVLTGNNTFAGGKARQMWDALGYPDPDWTEIHTSQDADHIAAWKAEQCGIHAVDLMIDDFKHGEALPVFLAQKPKTTQIFQIPYPAGAPLQAVR